MAKGLLFVQPATLQLSSLVRSLALRPCFSAGLPSLNRWKYVSSTFFYWNKYTLYRNAQ